MLRIGTQILAGGVMVNKNRTHFKPLSYENRAQNLMAINSLVSNASVCRDQLLEFLYDTWIYADRLTANPERRHKVKGRSRFAFSDARRIIAEAALDIDFHRVCPKPGNPPVNSLVAVLLRMVA